MIIIKERDFDLENYLISSYYRNQFWYYNRDEQFKELERIIIDVSLKIKLEQYNSH